MHLRLRTIALSFCLLAIPAAAETIVDSTTGISITVGRTGTYTIQSVDPPWTFSGAVAGGVTAVQLNVGPNLVGSFKEIVFDERAGALRHFGIRTWFGRQGVLFTQTLPDTCATPP